MRPTAWWKASLSVRGMGWGIAWEWGWVLWRERQSVWARTWALKFGREREKG